MLSLANLARAAKRTVVCRAPLSTATARRLPRLPVPNLENTLQTYLRSLQPLIKDDADRNGTSIQTVTTRQETLAGLFANGLGKTLQERLHALDRNSPHNWLDDNFWLKKAYLEWRSPLPIHSNWWLLFKEDANTPEDCVPAPPDSVSDWQLARAAWLTWRTLIFRDKLQKEEVFAESTRTGVWVRPNALKYFNMHRVPEPGCDRLVRTLLSDVPAIEEARHVLVMVDDWTYAVEVYTSEGEIASFVDILARFVAVRRDALERSVGGARAPAVGLLSADNRDLWAKNCERLRARNDAALRFVELSAFAVSLDSYVYPSPLDPQPFQDAVVDAHMTNIKIGCNGHNRWFDKCFTLIVENDGRAGMMGEHSPCDALVPSMIADWVLDESVDIQQLPVEVDSWIDEGWRRLDWELDETLEGEIERVAQETREMAQDSDNSALWFDEYGTEWIANSAKLAPDAYVQMALQLAWYKDQGYFTATYETALTRFFLHGRTETIRSFSAESRDFVLAMVDPTASQHERLAKLRAAADAHNAYSKAALTGKGIDRHLLGLRLLMQPGERAELFEDPLFAKSQDWRLSTSGLTPGERFMGTGFGTPLQEGYGIPYLSGPHLLRFGVESKVSCPATSTHRFKRHLVDSLREMRGVCIEAALVGEVARL